jgi:hypothetical protein
MFVQTRRPDDFGGCLSSTLTTQGVLCNRYVQEVNNIRSEAVASICVYKESLPYYSLPLYTRPVPAQERGEVLIG